ncbi:hypothetical protein NBG4_230011 [Candidatus Sulfobium mesophilum]|uniref:Uncharacterized protein n=1 Tax=Candidatus Sulfobium mesophilum TaxID=2016548 RepID=A0A2U3QG93_9BACT|nr:hypothetical protein NBG4_230011 [Candidatus Sulfobium mesophilum]
MSVSLPTKELLKEILLMQAKSTLTADRPYSSIMSAQETQDSRTRHRH